MKQQRTRGSKQRRAARVAGPSIPGMRTSISTTSMGDDPLVNASTASRPPAAREGRKPLRRKCGKADRG